MRRKEYEEDLRRLQVELVQMQRWIVQEQAKVCIVFEGRDTAGKGGVIKRLTERVSPRVFRVVALPAPTTVNAHRCTTNATSLIFPQAVRS